MCRDPIAGFTCLVEEISAHEHMQHVCRLTYMHGVAPVFSHASGREGRDNQKQGPWRGRG